MDVVGQDAMAVLQRTVTNDLTRVGVGQAQYNLVLNDRGGIVDDLIVYRLAQERYFVVPNAANTSAIHRIVRDEARSIDARADVVLHEDWAFLAVQGPRAVEVVGALVVEAGDLAFMECRDTSYEGTAVVLTRSGYTGEVGFELFFDQESAPRLWRDLSDAGAPFSMLPCGLGARDTLRLEMGYPLHGQDISEDRTPLEAGASWAVAMDKGEFRGRDALVAQKEAGIPARLWGLRMLDRLIPRPHYPVFVDGYRVGEVTSGTFSPTLRSGIALAYLEPRERFSAGDPVEVDVRGRRGPAEVTKPPFVSSSPR
jgi:aminomethyltransferase